MARTRSLSTARQSAEPTGALKARDARASRGPGGGPGGGRARLVAGPSPGAGASVGPGAMGETGAHHTLPGRAPELDPLIHERLRLGIVSALAVNDSLSFNDLKQLLRTSDGNLSVHARKLEEAGYISCAKYFQGRLPKTEYRLAPVGRQALEQYLHYMEALIQATRSQ